MSVVQNSEGKSSKSDQLVLIGKPILVGLLVTFIGIWVPIFFLLLIPGVGGLVAWFAFLFFFFLVASGRLFNHPDRNWRKERFRTINMDRRIFASGMGLALLFVVIGQAVFMVTFRLIQYPREEFLAGTATYATLSPAMVWVVVVISALGAGFYEEIGFRGYMQQPMEKTHGFLMANTVSSIVFMLIHLNQAWAPFFLPQLFMLSFLFGIIAYVTKSIIPGIVGHFVLDIFNFGYWWSNTIGSFEYQPIWSSGVDGHFVFWAVVFVLSSILFMWLARKILIENN